MMISAPSLAGALTIKVSSKHGDSQLARILADMCRPGKRIIKRVSGSLLPLRVLPSSRVAAIIPLQTLLISCLTSMCSIC